MCEARGARVVRILARIARIASSNPSPSRTHSPFTATPLPLPWQVVFKVAGAIRTLRAAYLKGVLESKHAPTLYIVCRDPATASIIAAQNETIVALAKSSKSPPCAAIHLVADGCTPPKGCATEVMDSNTEVHIFLKGVRACMYSASIVHVVCACACACTPPRSTSSSKGCARACIVHL